MTASVTPIVALDVPNAVAALGIVDTLGELCSFYKIGSELFTATGPSIVREVQARGASVFLDLKFHDIPNTVAGAVQSAATLGVRLLTVHASGGQAMIEAAVAAARGASTPCEILAVSVLTSMDARALGDSLGRPVADVEVEVLRLAATAVAAGAHGLVCSGREAAAIRARHGTALALLVPGVRLDGNAHQDQARVVTPRQAAEAGARYIVLGRTVTASDSARAAMSAVLADLS